MTDGTRSGSGRGDCATSLYRLYDADGALLYVGISGHLGVRMHQHERSQPWWRRVATATVAHFASRAEALAAERAAIIEEEPLHNIAGVRGALRLLPPVHSVARDDVYAHHLDQVAAIGAPVLPGLSGVELLAEGDAELDDSPLGWSVRAYQWECGWDLIPHCLGPEGRCWAFVDSGRIISFAIVDELLGDLGRGVVHLWTARSRRREGFAARLIEGIKQAGESLDGYEGPYTADGRAFVRSRPSEERPWWVEVALRNLSLAERLEMVD